MAKKSFGMGIDAILGTPKTKETPEIKFKKKNQTTFYKSCCLQIEDSQLEKFKAMAYWERIHQRDLLKKALNMYFDSLDKMQLENAIKQYKNRQQNLG